jgi:hypothetical protein
VCCGASPCNYALVNPGHQFRLPGIMRPLSAHDKKKVVRNILTVCCHSLFALWALALEEPATHMLGSAATKPFHIGEDAAETL